MTGGHFNTPGLWRNLPLGIVDKNSGGRPISLGVAVYKMKLPGITVVYGGVGGQVWLNPDEPVIKVDFAEVKVLYDGGKECSVPVENFQAFMVCLDGDVCIDDVLFISKGEVVNKSKGEVVNKLSILPIGQNIIEEFNR